MPAVFIFELATVANGITDMTAEKGYLIKNKIKSIKPLLIGHKNMMLWIFFFFNSSLMIFSEVVSMITHMLSDHC